ncbi:polysaccharide deacetylase [Prosthecobacter fusiformis]|uniref:Polysaccharide deacetylase n=1 Tax=Prosthecobacter fusiformis TaxID=48464 RepID=A0A4R7S4Q4_9BACT|nr:polysaccharide deacetylase family protein [Prosthecobacter fusiformis]TDU73422.1 polysaccharide deacetylase [Prosthecobacter fusiformis]
MLNRPLNRIQASVSLDLDNQWAYMKTQGLDGWQDFPSYLDLVTPRILDTMRRAGLRITVFVVGKDASLKKNHAALQSLTEEGHEIANHSHMHEPWLHLYNEKELEAEFDQSEEAIFEATGQRARGFRGPGFSTSAAVRDLLIRRGYRYDASLFPTVMGPVARAYFFFTSQLSPEEKAKRKGLYGNFSNAFSPLTPYQIQPGLLEIPVTTMPVFRTPVHLSYLLFLAQYSMPLARAYWDMAVGLCRLTDVAPSLLLHPTDFLDATDVPALGFFPAMKVPAEKKIELVRHALSSLRSHWGTATMGQVAHDLTAPVHPDPMKTETPKFNLQPNRI